MAATSQDRGSGEGGDENRFGNALRYGLFQKLRAYRLTRSVKAILSSPG